jgi:predicted Zn finger-like uncharacterized protein
MAKRSTRRGSCYLPPALLRKEPPRDATRMFANTERMFVECDECGERFGVNAEKLRRDGELDLKCPYCKLKLLVQHVEYAVSMTQED